MKKIILVLTVITMSLSMLGCSNKEISIEDRYKDAYFINLDSDKAYLNDSQIDEFDYTWHIDPSKVHDDVKDSPAEYYTGNKQEGDYVTYIDHELYYYPLLDEDKFKLIEYNGEKEWAYYYEDGVNNDYIFSTLPSFINEDSIPTHMMHSEDEASENKVLHICKAGTYVLSGNWDGQVLIDLGEKEDVSTDKNAKVTLVLNNVDINCTVAPGILFTDLYECNNENTNLENDYEVDTQNAGANIIIADGSNNAVSGKNIYRILKTKYKNEDSNEIVKVQKKTYKYDAPFYSCVSMVIDSEDNNTGNLVIVSNFEGLDSEMHLCINGGNFIIYSEDDGINVNEDGVSVFTLNDGDITLNCANGAEGDGIDSNGYIVINGGSLNINNVVAPDSALDSSSGIIYHKGEIYVDSVLLDIKPGTYNELGNNAQAFDPSKNRDFDQSRIPSNMLKDINFDIEDFKEKVASLGDEATLEDVLEILGDYGLDVIPQGDNRQDARDPKPMPNMANNK